MGRDLWAEQGVDVCRAVPGDCLVRLARAGGDVGATVTTDPVKLVAVTTTA